jgi:alpha/beta superfamily hydrolase
MKKIIYFSVLLTLISCKKIVLDQLAFPSEKLSSYEFELYDAGDQSVPEKYGIESKDRHLVSMISKDQSTGESYRIFGVYIGDTARIGLDTVFLYCHGQSTHMDDYYPRATLLANVNGKLNYGVLMIDYRGYGMSEGTSDEQGLSEDADAAINWLKERGATGEKTIFYGFSLGCIPMIERAAFRPDFKPSKLIIEAPLASVANLAQMSTIINIDPVFISSLKFENAENIKSVTAPLLWFHGIEDDYIALPNGQLIYDNYSGSSKEAVTVEGAGHGNIPATYGFDKYVEKLADFITP